tara:strand:+ start:436 stop:624 length:189 start_codon:yes stop_codon:yes gene_type:complete
MSSVINSEDKIWKLFLEYVALIDNEAITHGIDMYGTEHRTTLALGLTQAYYTDQIVSKINEY